MNTLPLPTPIGVAFRAQWRSVVSRIGLVSILLAFLITAALTAYSLAIRDTSAAMSGGPRARLDFLTVAHTLVLTAAFFLPGLLWKGLPPNGRRALHGMPIDRRTHELLRVATGGLVLLAFAVVTHLVGIVLQVRLAATPFESPSAVVWLVALSAPLLVYAMSSIAGLLTESATGTMLRVLVYGGVIAAGVAVLSGKLPMLAVVQDAILDAFFVGRLGVFTAAGAGARGFSGAFTQSTGLALVLWLAVALTGLWLSAGRLRRS